MKRNNPSEPSYLSARPGNIGACSWGAARRPLYRPTWAEIDTRAFRSNIRAVRDFLGDTARFMAVVKANAYGHLAVPLAKIAVAEGAASLGVSSIEEGDALRESGVRAPVLLMGSVYPMENLEAAVALRLTPTISSLQGLQALEDLGARLKKRLPFHLKVDTGMGRVGVSPESAPVILERAASSRSAAMTGMYMHFAAADSDPAYTRRQLRRFASLVDRARKAGMSFTAHAANSTALVRWPSARFDLVRPGISLYGLLPFAGAGRTLALEPVLSWKTRIVFLKRVPEGASISYCRTWVTKRPSVIATLPVGYADGYPRRLSNRGTVLVRGVRCPVAGRISMDMTMVDVTDAPGVSLGDEAVLIGCQGTERVSAEDVAEVSDTINYEVTCGISARVPRILL